MLSAGGLKVKQLKGRRGPVRTAVVAGLAVLALAASAPAAGTGSKLSFASTGQNSERRQTIPITKHEDAARKSVISLSLRSLPTLERGDRVEVAAEVQVTNTCALQERRCIGRRYRYSPRVSGQLVLARSPGRTKGVALSTRHRLVCSQRRPNRNHHCVLVFSVSRAIAGPRSLPCPAAACRINLVVGASNRRAKPGELLVIGADTPSGGIVQDKGRISAALRRGPLPMPVAVRTHHPRVDKVPVAAHGKRGRVSIASVRLGKLKRGTVIRARSSQLTSLRSLHYNAFIGTRLILATRPAAVRATPFVNKIATLDGTMTEQNGFNCTKGPSEFSSPCTTRKSGLTQLVRQPVRHPGGPVPLYVNLVVAAYPKLTRAGRHDAVRVKRVRLQAAIEAPPAG
jgi:hypothetical protein